MNAIEILAVVVLGYLLGAIPMGVFVGRWLAGIDPREAGSHNIGFTNVLRVAGNTAGALTLFGDMGKGAVAVLVASLVLGDSAGNWLLAAGGAAILGHVFPVFLRFKGGKGVATALGVMLAIDPMLGGSLVLIWLISLALWRTSSLAAIIAFACLPVLSWMRHPELVMLAFILGVSGIVAYRHAGNIRRLWAGTEPKFRIGHKPG